MQMCKIIATTHLIRNADLYKFSEKLYYFNKRGKHLNSLYSNCKYSLNFACHTHKPWSLSRIASTFSLAGTVHASEQVNPFLHWQPSSWAIEQQEIHITYCFESDLRQVTFLHKWWMDTFRVFDAKISLSMDCMYSQLTETLKLQCINHYPHTVQVWD